MNNFWRDGIIGSVLLAALSFGFVVQPDERAPEATGALKIVLLLVGGVGGGGFVASRVKEYAAELDREGSEQDYLEVEVSEKKRQIDAVAQLEAHQALAQVEAESRAERQFAQRMGIPLGLPPAPTDQPVNAVQPTEPGASQQAAPATADPSAANTDGESKASDATLRKASDRSWEDSILYSRLWNHRKRHIIVPAETGAGKTSFFLGAVKYFNAQDNATEFLINTCKPGPFLGLEDKPASDGKRVVNMRLNDPQSIELLIERLEFVQNELVRRQDRRAQCETTGQPYNPSRLIVVVDEWNTVLVIAERWTKHLANEWKSMDAAQKSGLTLRNYSQELEDHVNGILLLGREDEVAIWLMGQDHQVQNAGVNTGLMKNFGVVVPVRMEAQQAAEDALMGRSPVLPRTKGKEMMAELSATLTASPDDSFAYSNIKGHEILPVPHLPNIKRDRCFAPLEPVPSAESDDRYGEWA